MLCPPRCHACAGPAVASWQRHPEPSERGPGPGVERHLLQRQLRRCYWYVLTRQFPPCKKQNHAPKRAQLHTCNTLQQRDGYRRQQGCHHRRRRATSCAAAAGIAAAKICRIRASWRGCRRRSCWIIGHAAYRSVSFISCFVTCCYPSSIVGSSGSSSRGGGSSGSSSGSGWERRGCARWCWFGEWGRADTNRWRRTDATA